MDIVIEEYYNGITTISKMKLKNVREMDPPLESIPVYHYVHKTNKHLVPVLKYIIKEIYEDGTADNIINEVKEKLLEN